MSGPQVRGLRADLQELDDRDQVRVEDKAARLARPPQTLPARRRRGIAPAARSTCERAAWRNCRASSFSLAGNSIGRDRLFRQVQVEQQHGAVAGRQAAQGPALRARIGVRLAVADVDDHRRKAIGIAARKSCTTLVARPSASAIGVLPLGLGLEPDGELDRAAGSARRCRRPPSAVRSSTRSGLLAISPMDTRLRPVRRRPSAGPTVLP